MEKKRNSRATSNLKSATTKAKATVKSTVEKIEKTPAAEKTVKAVKKATETVAAKAPEVVEEVKNTVKNHKISGITGYLLLPEAFRSLSRLSSALSAKASTLRSF